ncbi:hypothetical protein EsH8_VIII_000696 [Colletotrichum jinshuiense]
MPPSSQKSDLTSSLSKLSLDGDKKPSAAPTSKTVKSKAKKPVVDSWEDDEDDDDDDDEEETPKPLNDGSNAPPPTPVSPTYNTADRSFPPYGNTDSSSSGLGGSGGVRRPEKTDAVARRMIASALGVKVPRLTEEQKAYDKAVKEKERKRREEEKAAERQRLEDAEKAKAAIWED